MKRWVKAFVAAFVVVGSAYATTTLLGVPEDAKVWAAIIAVYADRFLAREAS